jgi:hypothetical protein
MNLHPRDFFQTYSGLTPINCDRAEIGPCACIPALDTQLYHKNGERRCAACITLTQVYPPAARRLMGFMLIQPTTVTFWGNATLDEVNPRIVRRPNKDVLRTVVMHPPEPPWMFINFPQRNVEASELALTEDNRFPHFTAVSYLDIPLRSFDRRQVFALAQAGLKMQEWRQFIGASANVNAYDQKTLNELIEKYPQLNDLRDLPPINSDEFRALSLVLGGLEKSATSAARSASEELPHV